VLEDLIKKGAGGGFALGSLLSKGSKFNGLDIKRVYFGYVRWCCVHMPVTRLTPS